ncbi:MAG: cytochrome c biogenesis CcdA family protein [Solirubrobacterales bacterium]
MIDTPSIALAFAAGFVSFVSPCCLPLVPGYLATVSGVAPAERSGRLDPRVIGRSLLFVASFSSMFIVLGLTATALGAFVFRNQPTLNKVAGVAIIAMGVLFIASVFVARLNRDWHPQALLERAGEGGPIVVGLAFAIAWTPCVGPTLGAILGLAATGQSTAGGAGLLAIYSAGLAVPFLLSALAFNGAQRSFEFLRRHYAPIQVGAGLLLMTMGVLVLSGELFRLNIEVREALDGVGLDFWQSL